MENLSSLVVIVRLSKKMTIWPGSYFSFLDGSNLSRRSLITSAIMAGFVGGKLPVLRLFRSSEDISLLLLASWLWKAVVILPSAQKSGNRGLKLPNAVLFVSVEQSNSDPKGYWHCPNLFYTKFEVAFGAWSQALAFAKGRGI